MPFGVCVTCVLKGTCIKVRVLKIKLTSRSLNTGLLAKYCEYHMFIGGGGCSHIGIGGTNMGTPYGGTPMSAGAQGDQGMKGWCSCGLLAIQSLTTR